MEEDRMQRIIERGTAGAVGRGPTRNGGCTATASDLEILAQVHWGSTRKHDGGKVLIFRAEGCVFTEDLVFTSPGGRITYDRADDIRRELRQEIIN